MECNFAGKMLPTGFLLGVLMFLVFYVTIAAPLDFPTASLVRVTETDTIETVAQKLYAKHIISSPFLFVQAARILHGGGVVPGEYFFPEAKTVIAMATRITHGDFELVPVRVTIQEGLSVAQMALVLDKKIPDFDTTKFLRLASTKEGYLFPDTYFFVPGEDPNMVIYKMQKNFTNHITTLSTTTLTFGKPLADIVTMASLLEKEGSNLQNKRMIAGILWHRISIGMPLQVDAVFPYIIGKNTFQLTYADLKVKSPYNTYANKGLPPGPITNPGDESLLAAVTPIKSNYVFYLTDMSGTFHYSQTYEQQLANQRKYLK
ncbi:MAG: aminodeoxychorismate lyase, protein [Candidatus Adlerbacteria bacterium]|nr:aminodeoxychorismate lyase, protein [Candidatus Adlerbacteria bacterium]